LQGVCNGIRGTRKLKFADSDYNDYILATSQQKGDALEAVVAAVEALILETSPTTKDKTNIIESKKIVNVGGVRHEIDLYVTCDIAPGYKAIFIFECKNWKEAVGKNEIIVLSEKINACSAQHGYFVAKSFTSDAESQARKDPRVTLRIARGHDPVSTLVPFGFHFTFTQPKEIRVKFSKWGSDGTKYEPVDLSGALVLLNGTPVQLPPYLNEWTTEAINSSMLTFPSGTLQEGIYLRSCQSARQFMEGQLNINASDMKSAELEVEFQIQLKRPAVISHYEVGGRGRVIALEGYTPGGVTINDVQIVLGPESA